MRAQPRVGRAVYDAAQLQSVAQYVIQQAYGQIQSDKAKRTVTSTALMQTWLCATANCIVDYNIWKCFICL